MKKMICMILTLAVIAGCHRQHSPVCRNITAIATIKANYTPIPIVVDGRLDDAVWQTSRVYPMYLPKDQPAGTLQESGEVRLAWDKDYLYIGIKAYDSDIVAEGDADQLRHFELGDVIECFIKPSDKPWYWELYVTPKSNKSSFFFPSRGRFGPLPSNFKYTCGLKVAAYCRGTINNWQDKDEYWTAEMAIPVKDLTARGETFGTGATWKILVARYNYSQYLTIRAPEYSSSSQLSKTDFHAIEEYAAIEFVK